MSNQSTKEYLSTHKFFHGLSDGFLNVLCECSRTCEIKKGQVLFRQSEIADKFYIVREGRIAIVIPAIMGPTLVIQVLGMDQVLGWSWLIPPYKWNFQAEAQEDTELLMFDGKSILLHCEQDPKFGYELLKRFAALMSTRLDAARQKMMNEWNPEGYA
jgi:CRP-like cAMP-binding protein